MQYNKIKSTQLDLDEIYSSHSLSAVFAENGGGGGGAGGSVPPLGYISTEITLSQESNGIVDLGASFYWPSKADQRGTFLEVYLNGQRLTYGVEYTEEPVTGSNNYTNINKIYFYPSTAASGVLKPVALKEHDLLVCVIPTVLNYETNYIAQTAHYVHGGGVWGTVTTPGGSPNLIGGAYQTYTFTGGGRDFYIDYWCYESPAGPGVIPKSTTYQYLTGSNATGRSLSVYLNGVRLYYGIDYEEFPINNSTMLRTNYIRFREGFTLEVDDHLFFQTVNPGYLAAVSAGYATTSDFSNRSASASYASSAAAAPLNTQSVVNMIYPVGSIYMSVIATSPATLFGGTWAQLKDAFLLGAGDTYANGATGGEATHTLTETEMPAHTHSVNVSTVTTWQAGPSQATYPADTTPSNTSSTGGGAAHNNMPPYLVVYMWKRTI